MGKPVNKVHIRMGDTLLPKRGRALDPVIVIEVCRPDRWARIKDAAVCANDPGWNRNHIADRDGTQVRTFRELDRDYFIDCPDDREPYLDYLKSLPF